MAAEATPKAHNDHNVYILGAGFSAEAGLPLIKNFMNRMRDAAAWLAKQGSREQEVQAIERVLEFRLRAAAAAYRRSSGYRKRRGAFQPRLGRRA